MFILNMHRSFFFAIKNLMQLHIFMLLTSSLSALTFMPPVTRAMVSLNIDDTQYTSGHTNTVTLQIVGIPI